MKSRFISIIIMLFLPFFSRSQSFCKDILEKAEDWYDRNQYDSALIMLQSAERCDYKNRLESKRQALQEKVYDKIKQQKEEAIRLKIKANKEWRKAETARTEAEKARKEAEKAKKEAIESSEVAENNALLFKLQHEDPTLAMRIAEYNYANHPKSAAAIKSFRSIAFNPAHKYYRYEDLLQSEVYSVAYSPDNTKIAAGTEDGIVHVWDMSTHKIILEIKGHSAAVSSIAFSTDSKNLASVSIDGRIYLWSFSQLAEKASPSEYEPVGLGIEGQSVNTIAFSPDNTHLVSGSDDGMLRIWDIQTKRLMLDWKGHDNDVNQMLVTSDSSKLVSCAWDGKVKIWSMPSGEELASLDAPNKEVKTISVSYDNRYIAAGMGNGNVKIWETETWKELTTISTYSKGVCALSFLHNGNLAIGTYDGTLSIWRTAEAVMLFELKGHKSAISSLAGSPDGKYLVSGSWDNTVKLWDVSEKVQLKSLERHTKSVNGLTCNTDGDVLASASNDKYIFLWKKDGASFTDDKRLECGDEVTTLKFSPDCKILAAGTDSTGIIIWDAVTWQKMFYLEREDKSNHVKSIDFSSDNKYLAAGYEDGKVVIWEANTRQSVKEFGHSKALNCVAFSPDGKHLATASDDRYVKIWDRISWEEIIEPIEHDAEVSAVSFSPNGKRLASASKDKKIRIWDVATHFELIQVDTTLNEEVTSIAYSQKGEFDWLAAGSVNGEIKIWDAMSMNELFNFKGKTDSSALINSLCFAAGKSILATGSSDEEIRLWQLDPYLSNLAATFSPIEMWKKGAWLASKDFDSLDLPTDLAAAAGHLAKIEDWDKAISFYEKALLKIDSLPWLFQLYELAERTKKRFDIARFNKHQSRGEQLKIARYFERKGHYAEAIIFYEKIMEQPGQKDVLPLLRIMELSEKIPRHFDLSRLNSYSLRRQLLEIAQFFEQRGKNNIAISYIEKAITKEGTGAASLLLRVYELSEAAKRPQVLARLQRCSDWNEQQEIAQFFEEKNEKTIALYYYEKAFGQKATPFLIERMVELHKALGRSFNYEALLLSGNLDILKALYGNYFEKKQWQEAEQVTGQMLALSNSPEHKQYLYAVQEKQNKDSFGQLILASHDAGELRNHYQWFVEQAESQSEFFEKRKWFLKATQIGEKLLQMNEADYTFQSRLARCYNQVAWYGLLTQQFEAAEAAVTRGLEIIGPIAEKGLDKNNIKHYLQTNLPPAMLFSGKYDFREAAQKYRSIMNEEYPPRKRTHPYYRDVFLKDFEDLRKAEAIPKKYEDRMEKIIAILTAQGDK